MFNRVSKLYISLSGGYGQAYDLILIYLSKIFKVSTFIHHHSFAYLNVKNGFTRFIVNSSITNASHIVLCERMETALKEYNPNVSTRIISNIAFIENPKFDPVNSSVNGLTLGFLSNISFD